jgi:hypothetical protein
MSTETVVREEVATGPRSSVTPLVALGLREAKRLLKSPVYVGVLLLILAMTGLSTAADFPPKAPEAAFVYEGVWFFTALYGGLLTYMAAHLVSSSSRRTHADRQLASSVLSARSRGGGLCLGVIFGPGGVAAALVLLLAWLESFGPVSESAGLPELLQLYATVIGAGLFGVLVATWLRFPGSLPIGLVVIVFLTIALSSNKQMTDPLPWFAPYITAPDWIDQAWSLEGSQAWHAAYLFGLCALAVCGVMLREPDNRSRWIVVSGLTLLLTAGVGWAQL